MTPSLDIESNGTINRTYDVLFGNNEDIMIVDDSIELDVSVIDNISIFKCNYIYIHDLNRYYFVRDIIIINNKLYQFQLVEDTIVSLKEQYLKLDAIVERNQYRYDLNLEDNKMTYEFYQNVYEYVIDTGNEFNFNTDVQPNNVTYAISYYDNKGVQGSATYVNGVGDLLPKISNTASARNNFNKVAFTTYSNVNVLAKWGVDNASALSYVISLVCYPFQIGVYQIASEQLYLGNDAVEKDGQKAMVYVFSGNNNSLSPYYKICEFYVNTYVGWGDDYAKYEPYSTYELYLPYYGYIELKSSDIMNSLISVYYSFDWANGSAKINIVNTTKNYVIKSLNANVGIKVSVNRTNNQELNDEKTQLAIKSAISGIASVASIGVGAVSKNPYLIASGVTGIASTAVDVASKLPMMHERAYVSNNSGLDGLYGCQQCRLKVTRFVKREPSNYSSYYGRPLLQTIKLNQLVGFTTIKEIHLDDVDATKIEKDDLLNKLINGIIL